MPSYDYVILGAGIIGLATAVHLKRLEPQASVAVVDRGPAPGYGDTGRSMAAFRVFFTSRLNMLLARSSVEYYMSVQRSGKSLGLRRSGYLFLADRREMERVKEGLRLAEELGLNFSLLDPHEAARRVGVNPVVSGSEEAELLGVGDIEMALLVENAGFLDAEKLVEHYYSTARGMGVTFRFNSEAVRLLLKPRRPLGLEYEPLPWQDPYVAGVQLIDGVTIEAKKAVIAALGAYASRLLAPSGFDAFTRPKKRQIFRVQARGEAARALREAIFVEGSPPLIVLPRRLLLKPAPEEGSFWVQLSDEVGRPYGLEGYEPKPEEHYFTYAIAPLLSLYVPSLAESYPSGAWAGYYDVSPDGNPVVYSPEDSRLVIAGGTSGSGIMKGDAIGRAAASLAIGHDEAELYGGERLKLEWLGFKGRLCEEEKLIL